MHRWGQQAGLTQVRAKTYPSLPNSPPPHPNTIRQKTGWPGAGAVLQLK